jgi:hypothetical protein
MIGSSGEGCASDETGYSACEQTGPSEQRIEVMSKPFEKAKDDVAKLCAYFATNRQAFLAPGVKEAHVRQSLTDPLLEALAGDLCVFRTAHDQCARMLLGAAPDE